MKICVVNEFFRPHVTGGSEIFLDKLIDFLIAKGFGVKVITGRYGGSKEYEKDGNLEIYRINSSPLKIGHLKQLPGITFPYNFFNQNLESRLSNIMKDIDVFHINNLYHLSFAPLKVAKKMRKPILLDIHDYWPICFRKDLLFGNRVLCSHNNPLSCYSCLSLSNPIFIASLPALVIEFFLRNRLVKSRNVVVHSKFVADKIHEYSGMNSKFIPYPFLGKISRQAKKINDKINILFMGRLQIQKGAHLLPDIARGLEQHGIDYEMSILGSGSLSGKLKNIAIKENLKMRFFGFISDNDTKERIRKESHVLLLPSLWYEPFGIVVLEAMASGLPVIGSNLGGLGDLIKENGIGFAVQPDPRTIVEHLKILVDTPNLYRKFSSNGIRNIKKYNSKEIFKRYMTLFEDLEQ